MQMTDSNLTKPPAESAWPPTGQVYYGQQSYIQPGGPVHIVYPTYNDPTIAKIRDWLPWSIINLCIGGLFAGILPLIFSLLCRSYKRSNDASGARTMSTLALVFNILVTLAGIAVLITLIVLFAVVEKQISSTCYSYYNC